jgi:DNA helicase-2/ATP-dependent DNA helicase PcrA
MKELLLKTHQQLDQISLYSDLDQDVEDVNRVKLSTYHQVKGLEFQVVFMVVMEEGIFPGDRSLGSSFEIEEERRVAYVGMTRAKEKLYLSYADQRMLYGSMRHSIPSRFLKESKIGINENKEIDQNVYTQKHMLRTGDHVMHQVFEKVLSFRDR